MSAANLTDFCVFDDKELSNFHTLFDCSLEGLFEQYFPHDDFQDSSDNSNESNFFEDLDMGLSADNSITDTPSSKVASPQYQPLHTWRANAWRSHRITPVPQSQKLVHRLRPDGAAISGIELLSLEGKLRVRRPPPIGPSLLPTTPPSTPSQDIHCARSSSPITSLPSEQKISPNMMRPSSYYANQDSPLLNEWTEKFQEFSLQGPIENLPLSPPSSAKVPQHEQSSRMFVLSNDFDTVSPPPPTNFSRHNQSIQGQVRAPLDDTYFPTMQDERNSASWLQSSNLDFDLGPSQADRDWSNLSQPSSLFDQNNEAHTGSQDYMQMSPNFASQGLLIQCEPFQDGFQGSQPASEYLASAFEPFEAGSAVRDDGDYSSDISPANRYKTMRKHRSPSRSQSPSPPSSPQTPSSARRRAKYHRRKSSAATTPRASKTPTAGSGAVGFVNFTPNDSRKILGGVAPSGSSKTKARREKEASERRRKLSEAAAKAIREAGGDVEALKKEGLLI